MSDEELHHPKADLVSQQLIGMYMQCWASLALLKVAELGVADVLAICEGDVTDVAGKLRVEPRALFRILRALSARGVFTQTGATRFANSSLSSALRRNAPGGARELICAIGLALPGDWQGGAFAAALNGCSTGPLLGNETYNRAMTAAAAMQLDAIHRVVDFGRFRRIVDIGGGQGLLLASTLARNPGQLGVLFDRSDVVEGAPPILEHYGVENRCTVTAGDFHENVPADGDAYILKNILHGIGDAQCDALVRRIGRHAYAGAHLFVIEHLIPEGATPVWQALFDLYLLSGGVENGVRTQTEMRLLLSTGGFEVRRIIPADCGVIVIDATRTSSQLGGNK